MATRPVFIPCLEGNTYVTTHLVEFEWFAGMATSQKQKSIAALHQSAQMQLGLTRLLEISSKSQQLAGIELSAFNLTFTTVKPQITMSVECAFQGSKVFENGGPYMDLFHATSREAKKDPRLQDSGRLTAFSFFGSTWPLEPQTVFYDWLYLNALHKNPALVEVVLLQQGFTDIEFNPKKSINCQAYSAALYASLAKRGLLTELLNNQQTFLQAAGVATINNAHEDQTVQSSLF